MRFVLYGTKNGFMSHFFYILIFYERHTEVEPKIDFYKMSLIVS